MSAIQILEATVTVTVIQEVKESVVSDSTNTSIITLGNSTNLVTDGTNYNVVAHISEADTVHSSAGIQGPPGVSAEELDLYSKRIDFVSDNLIYKGEAVAGSSDSSPVWRIRKIDISSGDGDISDTWADGNTNFDNAWTDRLIKVYT